MIKIKVEKAEEGLGVTLNKQIKSIGVDTASRAGICTSWVDKGILHLDTEFVHVDSSDLYFKYNQLLKTFRSLFSKCAKDPVKYKLVIEDTFLKFNVKVLKMLTRLGMIVYICGHDAGIEDIKIITPKASRALIGLDGKLKKEAVHKELSKKLGIEITDGDIGDSIVLSLCGLVEPERSL